MSSILVLGTRYPWLDNTIGLCLSFLDRHYVWRSHDHMSGIWSIIFWGLIVFRLPLYGVFRFWVSSFYICVSFLTSFFRLFYGATQTDPDRLSSCASRSDSLISLSYLMAVLSTKSFGLFLWTDVCSLGLWESRKAVHF